MSLAAAARLEDQAEDFRSQAWRFDAQLESVTEIVMAAWQGSRARMVVAGFDEIRQDIRSACLAQARQLENESTEMRRQIRVQEEETAQARPMGNDPGKKADSWD